MSEEQTAQQPRLLGRDSLLKSLTVTIDICLTSLISINLIPNVKCYPVSGNSHSFTKILLNLVSSYFQTFMDEN